MGTDPALNLGAWRRIDGTEGGNALRIPARHLVTHGVVVGMTGSGKTGLLTVLVEEALSAGVPTLVIDVKGDLPNLLLSFPGFDPADLQPWVEAAGDEPAGSTPSDLASSSPRAADASSQAGLSGRLKLPGSAPARRSGC